MERRKFLSITGFFVSGTFLSKGFAEVINSTLPWEPNKVDISFYPLIDKSKRAFFNNAEYKVIEAIAETLIPADNLSISGKDAGCAIFIDYQLAEKYGDGTVEYLKGPFKQGTKIQGRQDPYTPADIYKMGLASLETYCQKNYQASFDALSLAQRTQLLEKMEKSQIHFDSDITPKRFFEQVLQNVREGFLADPIYGGNKEMAGWKMIGFPGAMYDYRPYMNQKGKNWNIKPSSLLERTIITG